MSKPKLYAIQTLYCVVAYYAFNNLVGALELGTGWSFFVGTLCGILQMGSIGVIRTGWGGER